MKASLFESLTIPQNSIINPCSIQGLKGAKNLKCLTLSKVIFDNYKLSDLPIDKSFELKYLNLQGSTGLKILPMAQNVIGTYNAPVPFEWKNLTMLGILNFRDMGLTPAAIDNLIIGFSQVAPLGIGSASAIKKIYLDGNNSAPTSASATQLASLSTLGWTVYHSDLTKIAELEPNPCCGGDCVDCGNTIAPIVPIMLSVPSTSISNANGHVHVFNIPGVVVGGNNNLVPASILGTEFDTIEIDAVVTANDTVTITITNNGGSDVMLPAFNYNLFINP
jgi:hypothetical protein